MFYNQNKEGENLVPLSPLWEESTAYVLSIEYVVCKYPPPQVLLLIISPRSPPPLLPAWGGGGVDCYNHETSHSLLDLFLLSQKNFVYSIDDSFLYLKGVWIWYVAFTILQYDIFDFVLK